MGTNELLRVDLIMWGDITWTQDSVKIIWKYEMKLITWSRKSYRQYDCQCAMCIYILYEAVSVYVQYISECMCVCFCLSSI